MPREYDDYEEDLDELSGEDQEIIGDEEIIGAMDEIIGMRAGRGRRSALRRLERRMGRLRNVDPNAVAVQRNVGGKRRRKVLPGTALVLAADETGKVTFETEELFRPERFVVASTDVENFSVTSITVGTSNQFAADGDCPAEIFRPDAVDMDVHFKTANVGNKIVVTVTNNDGAAPHTFRCAFLGTSIAGE